MPRFIAPFILPLCTIDEVRAELADTEASIDRIGAGRIVSLERRNERLTVLRRWQQRLTDQLRQMEAQDV